MADEADSGTSNTTAIYPPEPPTTNEDPDNENEKVSASNSNYDSNDGSSPIFRCERCDKFETQSQPLLLVHYVQCNNTANASSSIKQQDAEENELDNSLGSATVSESEKQQQSRKLFECDVCNMKFSNGANMRRHKMRHTGVKPYECRVCQKRFFRKDHLAEHFTTHTKTLPYHCPICNRGFQRQIAMRAHFQNEHVGQHDLVKTCPLCSFRAGTMKSLRVHFFNRHGIDLDNPGPGGPSSLLLALEPQNAAHYLPSLSTTVAPAPSYSDSGDSLRSADNATPPMHFLTPHVEISMAENADSFHGDTGTSKVPNSTLEVQPSNGPCGGSPSSPQSADSNSNIPSSSHTLASLVQSPRPNHSEGHITPSISLIPIKQEPTSEEYSENKNGIANSSDQISVNSGVTNSPESATPTSSLTSLIKVSPLKSLLREDLKRRICARASNRITRNGGNVNSNSATTSPEAASCNAATTSNGVITSTGQEGDLLALSRKKQLQCLFCGIEFPDQTLYFLHKGCHSESNPWKCNICGEQCNNVYEFNSHLLSKSHQ
ncbi:zinc finger protein ztf-16 [Hermetia illucens]|nr:zinc finger protein ztf-16 [Hermetia illucens]